MYLNWQLHAKKHTNLLEWLPPQNTNNQNVYLVLGYGYWLVLN